MALDFGTRRIGVAVCDELEIAALPAPTIERDGMEFELIAGLVAERNVELIVVGLPLQMDGTEGPAARKVRSFIKELKGEVPGPQVATVDERLSSAQAHAALSEMGANMQTRGRYVDGMAAQIILHRYMERRRAARRETE